MGKSKSKDKFGVCGLCQKEAKLCNSHIIPKFCYKLVNDDKHRSRLVHTSNLEKSETIQNGSTEPLLCLHCEDHLAKIEKAFNKDWSQKKWEELKSIEKIERKHGLDFKTSKIKTRIFQIDYNIYKRFSLLVLFRAHLAKRKEFSNVKIKKYYERRMRNYLLQGSDENKEQEVIPENFIPTFLLLYSSEAAHSKIDLGYKNTFKNYNTIAMEYADLEWHYTIADQEPRTPDLQKLAPCKLSEDNSLVLLVKNSSNRILGR